MKKFIRIICAMLVGSIIVCSTGCKEKEAISADDFTDKMEKESFKITDLSDQYADQSYNCNSCIIAKNDDYQIEFYDFKSNKTAEASFKKNKENFENDEGSSVVKNSVKVGNHGFYESTSNGKYNCVSFIDNTMVYVSTDKANKKEVKSMIKKLGYGM